MSKFFVYLTTNLINGKQYIGDHNNLKDAYYGSGLAIHRAIKKYGKQNFNRRILEYFDTKKDAFNAQEKYIKQYQTLQPNGYNISPKGGNGIAGCHSEESKRKIALNNSNRIISDETKILMSQNNRGSNNPMFGKKLSIEARERISKSQKGRIKSLEEKNKIRNAKIGTHLSEEAKNKLREFNSGKKLSAETKEKIRKSLKGKPKPKILCRYCNKTIDIVNFGKWHGIKCKSFPGAEGGLQED